MFKLGKYGLLSSKDKFNYDFDAFSKYWQNRINSNMGMNNLILMTQ